MNELKRKWFVVKEDGETSGGIFETREKAEEHLARGLELFAGIAEEYRVVEGLVSFLPEEKHASLSQ